MTSYTLTFDADPKKYWHAIGLLKDNKGHDFRVFVSGKNKADVQRFIAQSQEGKIQINVRIETPSISRPNDAYSNSPLVDEPPAQVEPDIRIGISRLAPEELFDIGSKITYTIDPDIDRDKIMAFTFDDQNIADIRCEVSAGSVGVVLYERDQFDIPQRFRQESTVHAGVPQEFHERAILDTRKWGIMIIGRSLLNTFVLSYDKLVL